MIMGPDGIDPGALPLEWHRPADVAISSLRVAWFDDNGIATPSPATRQAVRDAVQALAEAGAKISEARPRGIESTLDVSLPIYFWDGGASVRRLLLGAGTERHTLEAFTSSEALQPEQLDAAHARLDAWRSGMLSFVSGYDVLVCPVNAEPAFPVGGGLDEDMIARASYAVAFNVTGWPALVVPAGQSPEGLPIGVQVVAGPAREDRVLAAGRIIERALGGFRRPPAI